jgi:soluble lytic murein transglycosylase-like protein
MGKSAATIVAKLALGLVAGLALSACSVAGLKDLLPMKSRPQQVAAVARPAPVPMAEADAEPFIPMAFVEPAPAGPTRAANLDGLISRYSGQYNVPESLVRRVIARESGYNPNARNGPYLGLMQIRHDTARSMGYSGSASGLLDAETNLKYAVKYLAGAYIVGGRNQDQAVRNYSRGYYYDAKRKGLLEEAGLR